MYMEVGTFRSWSLLPLWDPGSHHKSLSFYLWAILVLILLELHFKWVCLSLCLSVCGRMLATDRVWRSEQLSRAGSLLPPSESWSWNLGGKAWQRHLCLVSHFTGSVPVPTGGSHVARMLPEKDKIRGHCYNQSTTKSPDPDFKDCTQSYFSKDKCVISRSWWRSFLTITQIKSFQWRLSKFGVHAHDQVILISCPIY